MLDTLNFDNRFTRELPADPESKIFSRPVPGAAYSRVLPTPVALPELIAHSREMAEELDISESDIASAEFSEIFGGNRITGKKGCGKRTRTTAIKTRPPLIFLR